MFLGSYVLFFWFSLSPSLPEDWHKWSKRFERIWKVSGFNLKEENMQVNKLLYSMANTAEDVLCSFQLFVDDAKSYLYYRGGEIQAALRSTTCHIQMCTI